MSTTPTKAAMAFVIESSIHECETQEDYAAKLDAFAAQAVADERARIQVYIHNVHYHEDDLIEFIGSKP